MTARSRQHFPNAAHELSASGLHTASPVLPLRGETGPAACRALTRGCKRRPDRQSFFMSLLGRRILLGTSWSHRYPPEAETPEQIADRPFGELDPIAVLDHLREVDAPLAHHAVLGQIRPVPDQLGHLPFLLGREPRLCSRRSSVVKTLEALGIVAVHPVAQDLPIHAGRHRG